MHDWTREFFAAPALDAWQRSRSAELTEREVAFLQDALALGDRPRRLLDVPCGDGRHAVALAAMGHHVTGVDGAADNAARAAARAQAAGAAFDFVQADMRQLLPGGPFDAAYCMGNSFGYFPRDETRRFLSAVAERLASGGRFVLDTESAAECVLLELQRQSFLRVDHELVLLFECDYDAAQSCLSTTYTSVLCDRVVDRRTAYHYVFTCAEIIAMLADAGLHTHALLGDLDESPFELGSERLLLIAERR